MPANEENRLKQMIIQMIVDEIIENMNTSSISSTTVMGSNRTGTHSSSPMPAPKRRKLFHYKDRSANSDNQTTQDPMIEIQAYLDDPVNLQFSDYWYHSQLHLLKRLVERIFSVQTSSAPVERVFSQAGLILSSRRTALSEKLFQDLVFLRVNRSLL